MQRKLHLLDSFAARGSDGQTYKVMAYEHLVLMAEGGQQWEPTGQLEYRLADGRRVAADATGHMSIADTAVTLLRHETAAV
jgi:hypothetical protein